MARRLPSPRFARPLVLLGVLSVLSLGARLAFIAQPCRLPCRSASDHLVIFDEVYYVNAARVIAGIHPPAGAPYARAPLGSDPNAEHPQLAKLIMAGSIELFGDDAFAWRIGSVLFGSLAILGMFALARAAGAGPWVALCAAALMALDNLAIVHGRIGTLDVYALAAMLWGAAAYLRGRPVLAGVIIGVGACFKLVEPYVLAVLLVAELASVRDRSWRSSVRSFASCLAAAAVVFLALLTLLDQVAPPHDPVTRQTVSGDPLGHLSHMLSYAAHQSSPRGPSGIASYPWEWLGDVKWIVYLNINPSRPSAGLRHVHPAVHFIGLISPPILLIGLVGLVMGLVAVARRRADRGVVIGLAWFLGTWVPFEALSVVYQRTSYLYYMLIVMPGLYLLAAQVIARARAARPRLMILWWVTVVVAAVVAYPFTPLP